MRSQVENWEVFRNFIYGYLDWPDFLGSHNLLVELSPFLTLGLALVFLIVVVFLLVLYFALVLFALCSCGLIAVLLVLALCVIAPFAAVFFMVFQVFVMPYLANERAGLYPFADREILFCVDMFGITDVAFSTYFLFGSSIFVLKSICFDVLMPCCGRQRLHEYKKVCFCLVIPLPVVFCLLMNEVSSLYSITSLMCSLLKNYDFQTGQGRTVILCAVALVVVELVEIVVQFYLARKVVDDSRKNETAEEREPFVKNIEKTKTEKLETAAVASTRKFLFACVTFALLQDMPQGIFAIYLMAKEGVNQYVLFSFISSSVAFIAQAVTLTLYWCETGNTANCEPA